MVYPALLPLMRTPRLPAVDRTDAPADLNGLVHFSEKRNLVSARVPSHFKRSVLTFVVRGIRVLNKGTVRFTTEYGQYKVRSDSEERVGHGEYKRQRIVTR